MTTKTRDEVQAAANAFTARLNENAAVLIAQGKKPLYKTFGVVMGAKHAKIFTLAGGSRSAHAFVCNDGTIRRADSWKAAGRILGAFDSEDAFAYCVGPILGSR